MERLIDRITDDDIPLLDAHLTQEREADQRGDTSATIRLSGGFHLLLAEPGGIKLSVRHPARPDFAQLADHGDVSRAASAQLRPG